MAEVTELISFVGISEYRPGPVTFFLKVKGLVTTFEVPFRSTRSTVTCFAPLAAELCGLQTILLLAGRTVPLPFGFFRSRPPVPFKDPRSFSPGPAYADILIFDAISLYVSFFVSAVFATPLVPFCLEEYLPYCRVSADD